MQSKFQNQQNSNEHHELKLNDDVLLKMTHNMNMLLMINVTLYTLSGAYHPLQTRD